MSRNGSESPQNKNIYILHAISRYVSVPIARRTLRTATPTSGFHCTTQLCNDISELRPCHPRIPWHCLRRRQTWRGPQSDRSFDEQVAAARTVPSIKSSMMTTTVVVKCKSTENLVCNGGSAATYYPSLSFFFSFRYAWGPHLLRSRLGSAAKSDLQSKVGAMHVFVNLIDLEFFDAVK